MSLGAVIRLSRPFTLLAPALGMLSGTVAALGFVGKLRFDDLVLQQAAIGALCAALLNVASNGVNQIYDLEVDRINKPERPLPAGDLTVRQAGVITAVSYALALLAAWLVNDTLFWIVVFTAALTYAYSGPPLRTKRHWAFSNLTIATPRGFLLPLAGWAVVTGTPELAEGAFSGHTFGLPPDAGLLAAASGLFILGAASTKDYADLEGDRAGGCITIPLYFGVRRSTWMIAPFLCIPWLLYPVGSLAGWLSGNAFVLVWGGALLVLVGARAAWLLVARPDALTDGSTHPAWVLMYLLMLGSQFVMAGAYAAPTDWMAGLAP